MKLDFSKPEKYTVFNDGEKPKLKDEYWKTYYAIIELTEDWYDRNKYNFGGPKNTLYKKGYYIIPVMIWPQKWVRKFGIFVYPRKFQTIWCDPINSEPQDVSQEHWKDCENFKYYWGIAEHMNDGKTVDAEDIEIYDNLYEATIRAKALDQLQVVLFKIGEISDKLQDKKYRLVSIESNLNRNIYKNDLYKKLDEIKKEIYFNEITEITKELEKLNELKQKLGQAYNNRPYEDYIHKGKISYRLSTI